MSENQTVPTAPRTESSLLGWVLTKRKMSVWHEFVRFANEEPEGLFYFSKNRTVARALQNLSKLGKENITTPEVVDVLNAIDKEGRVSDWEEHIYALTTQTEISNGADYAGAMKTLQTKATLRDQLSGAREIVKYIESGSSEDASETITPDHINEMMASVQMESTTTSEVRVIGDIIDDLMSRKEASWTLSTGITAFDQALNGGLRPGTLTIVGADTKIGKTTLAQNFAVNALFGYNSPVAKEMNPATVVFVSLETMEEELTAKMVGIVGGVPWVPMRNVLSLQSSFDEAYPDIESREDAEYGLRVIRGSYLYPIFPREMQNTTVSNAVASVVMTARNRHPESPVLVVVDYLQIASKTTDPNDIAETSRSLKLLAAELDVPVVALSQVRKENLEEGEMPRYKDLKGSSSIYQDADTVIMLNRKGHFDKEYDQEEMQVDIPLIRGGQSGEFAVRWQGNIGLISDKEFVDDGGFGGAGGDSSDPGQSAPNQNGDGQFNDNVESF